VGKWARYRNNRKRFAGIFETREWRSFTITFIGFEKSLIFKASSFGHHRVQRWGG